MRLARAMDSWLGRGAMAVAALLLLIAPRLITAAPLDLLDAPDSVLAADPAEDPKANFTGSAFFFAEGAFDPAPGAEVVRTEHVLGLDSVKSAPAAIFRGLTPLDSYRALNCLTSAIYYEAANEPEDGQRAVAQVVLNRVRSRLWPATVCGVVYEGSERTDYHCQFTFSCDGSMARMPMAAAWARARRVAAEALAGHVYTPVGLATHYHTLAVHPDWSGSLHPVAVIGAHIFYRRPGFDGTPAAFTTTYLGRETISGPARTSWPAKPAPALPGTALLPTTPPAATMPGYVAPTMQYPTMAPPAATPERPAMAPAPRRDDDRDNLPESTIRPEYRNSGRPIV